MAAAVTARPSGIFSASCRAKWRLTSLRRLSQRRAGPRAWLSNAAGPYRSFSIIVRAIATTPVEAPYLKLNMKTNRSMDVLACPICYSRFKREDDADPNVMSSSRCSAYCENCRKAYSDEEAFLDLTVTSNSNEYSEYQPLFSEIFRSPLVSFLYERGWRQNFVWGGFPGPDKEELYPCES